MKFCQKPFLVLAIFVIANSQVFAQTLYQDPIKIQAYVTNPAQAIKQSLPRYTWELESEQGNNLIAKLNYKDYLIRVNITYDTAKIDITALSQERINCVVTKREKCEVEQGHIDRWRSNLRRSITKTIHDIAIEDAYTQTSKQ